MRSSLIGASIETHGLSNKQSFSYLPASEADKFDERYVQSEVDSAPIMPQLSVLANEMRQFV